MRVALLVAVSTPLLVAGGLVSCASFGSSGATATNESDGGKVGAPDGASPSDGGGPDASTAPNSDAAVPMTCTPLLSAPFDTAPDGWNAALMGAGGNTKMKVEYVAVPWFAGGHPVLHALVQSDPSTDGRASAYRDFPGTTTRLVKMGYDIAVHQAVGYAELGCVLFYRNATEQFALDLRRNQDDNTIYAGASYLAGGTPALIGGLMDVDFALDDPHHIDVAMTVTDGNVVSFAVSLDHGSSQTSPPKAAMKPLEDLFLDCGVNYVMRVDAGGLPTAPPHPVEVGIANLSVETCD